MADEDVLGDRWENPEVEEWERPETTYSNLLVVLSVPSVGASEMPDADEMASGLVQILNETRRKDNESTGYQPPRIMVHAIPPPQWLSGPGMKVLIDAVHILHYAQEHAAALDPQAEEREQ